ncbi:protein kinase-like protein [Trypanosoma rangeli SC58]|uniref:Protein kinase-like protein n=1 Tax=Trypanosoma rangeli SC58 TaxID=429131 RepID=A0A061J0H6_TRYRA|nr:protein kinase-like protein [Trypanosoma rangeli SC58]
MERVFYGPQMRPCIPDVTRKLSARKRWPRRRAASSPPLQSPTLDFGRGKRSNISHASRRRREAGRATLPNNKGGVVPLVLPSSLSCRKVSCLQDSYVFHPEADFVGCGTFSRVFRAVPLFRAASSLSFVAIKVIPRRRWKNSTLISSCMALHGGAKVRDVKRGAVREEAAVRSKLNEQAVEVPARDYCGLEYHDAMHRELMGIEREISIVRSLRYTGCAQFVEALRTPDEFVIVMNIGRGCMDARRYFRLNGPLSDNRAALIIYQLVKTVSYLHCTHGLIHRDIKLENVLLSRVDASQDCIRKVLGAPLATHTHEVEDSVTEVNGAAIKTMKYKENKQDAKPPRRCLTSVWGPLSVERRSEKLERLLKVTLVDFGLARRTTRRGDRCPGRASGEDNVGKPQSNDNSSTCCHHVGMPTPVPSAANMFASVDSESASVAASSDMIPTGTTACSVSNNDDARGDDDDVGEENDAYVEMSLDDDVGNNDGADTYGRAGEGVTVAVGGEASTGTLEALPRVPAAEMLPRFATRAGVGRVAGVKALNVSVPTDCKQEGEPDSGMASSSAAQCFARFCGDSTHCSAATASMTTTAAAQMATLYPSAVFTERGESNSRSWREEPQYDGETLLYLTPCGTDKYLPPEMLSWTVNCGWKRKPTTLRMARQLDAYAIGIVAYVLLSGCFPFNGASRASMAQQQQRCTPKCNSAHWKHVSPEAISFVQSLLEPDPEVRSTVTEVLAHPWLRRAAKFAEKLLLVPESLEELQVGGNAPVGASTRRGDAQTPSPHMRQQQGATFSGRHSKDVFAAADNCGCALRRSSTHDNFIYCGSRASVTPKFLPSKVEHAGAGGAVEASEEQKPQVPSTRTTMTAMPEKEARCVASTVSPLAWPSQALLSASPPTQTASSLLAQISAMQRASYGCDDVAGMPLKMASETAEEKMGFDDENDPFQRIFKTVMSGQ